MPTWNNMPDKIRRNMFQTLAHIRIEMSARDGPCCTWNARVRHSDLYLPWRSDLQQPTRNQMAREINDDVNRVTVTWRNTQALLTFKISYGFRVHASKQFQKSAPNGRIFMTFNIRRLIILLKFDKTNGYVRWRPKYIYGSLSLNSS